MKQVGSMPFFIFFFKIGLIKGKYPQKFRETPNITYKGRFNNRKHNYNAAQFFLEDAEDSHEVIISNMG